MDVRFCERQEPSPRGTRCELWILKMLAFARSSVARVGRILFSLDNHNGLIGPLRRMKIGVEQ